MTTTAIFLARGNSKGVPRKNLRLLGGKPLIAWSIEAALGAKQVDEVLVTTEDEEIAAVSRRYGAGVLKRPPELSLDHVQSNEVFLFALRQLEKGNEFGDLPVPDLLVLMLPTVPFRNSLDIDGIINEYKARECGSVISVVTDKKFHWGFVNGFWIGPVQHTFPRQGRQHVLNWLWYETGATYVVSSKDFSEKLTYWLPPYGVYVLPEERALDIDTEFDFWLAERYLEYKK